MSVQLRTISAWLAALLLASGAVAQPSRPAAETLKSTEAFATGGGLVANRDTLPGAAVYGQHCAFCHDGAVQKAPHMQWLEMMPPRAIVNSLTTGVMAGMGKKLTPAERLQVAEYLTRQPLAKGLPPENLAPQCTAAAMAFDRSRPLPAVGWGHDPRRFVSARLGEVTAGDLPRLTLKWAYAFPNATRARSQPVIAMGAVFVGSEDGRVYAFDLKTGCMRWIYRAAAEVRTGIVLGGTQRRPLLFFGDILAKLYAVDALTGKRVWSRRMDDHPSATLTGTPLYRDGRLFVPVSSLEVVPAANPAYACCTFRGKVTAVAAATGKTLWQVHAIPGLPKSLGKNDAGVDRFAPSGAPVWSSPTYDARRGLVYFGTGENYSSPADSNSDAIIAVDARTGARRWQRQTISGDAWNVACMMADNPNCPKEKGPDFDHSASTLLVDMPGGKQLLVAGHKNGTVFALDPDAQGKMLWTTKIGRGSIQGGVHFGLAADGATLYVPINDMNNTRNGQVLDAAAARPGMHAVDLSTGKILWSRVQRNICGDQRPFCDPGISAAATAIPGAVIAGHLDGHLRGYAEADGKTLFDFDTAKSFRTVNAMPGKGGGMSGPGAAIGEGYVAVNSGYGLYFHEPGNLLLVFDKQ